MSDQDKKQESSKIIIDQDWKAQARAEKERLAAEQEKKAQEQAAATGGAGGGEGRQMPPANFTTLVSTIASQALFALGAFPDPQTGKRYVNLEMAKHQIDMLKVLEDKTAGNLNDEEKKILSTTAYELRTHYVQVVQQVSRI